MTQPSDKNEQTQDKDLSLAKPRRSRRRRIVYWVFVIILSCLFLLLCGAVYIWVNRYALMEDIAVDALADTGVEAKLSIESVNKTQAVIKQINLSENGSVFFSADKIIANYEWRDVLKGQATGLKFIKPSGRVTIDETGKIIDSWLPDLQNNTGDEETVLPPDGIKIQQGSLVVVSPYGEINTQITAEYYTAENFNAALSIAPTNLAYDQWQIQGGGDIDISLSGNMPKIKTDIYLERLDHPAFNAQNLSVKSDLIPHINSSKIDISGPARFTFDVLNTKQLVTKSGQFKWIGNLNLNREKSALSLNGDWDTELSGLSIPDPKRRRDLSQRLSLSEALAKTPIAQNFSPDLTLALSDLLTDARLTATGHAERNAAGMTLSLNAPAELLSQTTRLTLKQNAQIPIYRFDKTASDISLAFDAEMPQPAGFRIQQAKFSAHSKSGFRLGGVKAFSGKISTQSEWSSVGIDKTPARLSPFQAQIFYSTLGKKTLRITGDIDYDGLLPGAVVTGMKAGGEVIMNISDSENLMEFLPKDDLPITIARVATKTQWRAHDVSVRLLTRGPIYRRKPESSDITAKLADVSFSAIDKFDERNLDLSFRTMDVVGALAGETQNWVLDAETAKITSENTPGPGTDIQIPSMHLELWRDPNKDLRFDMRAPSADAKTQLVKALGINITAQGSPDDFVLNYDPGQTLAGEVKFTGEALPPLPMTGQVHYKDGAFSGTAQTYLPFGENTPINVTYNFKDGAGTARVDIPELLFAPGGLQPQTLAKAMRGKIAEVNGAVGAQINLKFASGEPLQSSGSAQLKSLSFGTLPGPLNNVSTELSFSSFFPLQSQGRQTLNVGKFDPGFPLENGVIEFEIIPDGVKVYSARWPLGNGSISLDPFDWLYSAPENRVTMRISNVSLGEFLKDIGDGTIEATGDIEGMLPIIMAGVDVKVDQGQLIVKEGGVIKFNSEQIDSAATYAETDNDAVQALRERRYRDAAFQALKEFQYRSLTVNMDGPLDGAIEVALAFDGSNSQVLNNQPFRFNINIEGELLNILRSFNTNDQIKAELARRQLELESLPPDLE